MPSIGLNQRSIRGLLRSLRAPRALGLDFGLRPSFGSIPYAFVFRSPGRVSVPEPKVGGHLSAARISCSPSARRAVLSLHGGEEPRQRVA